MTRFEYAKAVYDLSPHDGLRWLTYLVALVLGPMKVERE